ncbi:hypothetical protein Nmel_009755 [Mimus melanotis]
MIHNLRSISKGNVPRTDSAFNKAALNQSSQRKEIQPFVKLNLLTPQGQASPAPGAAASATAASTAAPARPARSVT